MLIILFNSVTISVLAVEIFIEQNKSVQNLLKFELAIADLLTGWCNVSQVLLVLYDKLLNRKLVKHELGQIGHDPSDMFPYTLEYMSLWLNPQSFFGVLSINMPSISVYAVLFAARDRLIAMRDPMLYHVKKNGEVFQVKVQ